MTTPPTRDPIPAYEHAVLSLFEGPLADVRFPDVDGEALEGAQERCLDAQRTLESAEAALDAARRALADKQSELAKLARKAVAYARVLSEDDPKLAEHLAALAPRATEPAAPKKRGRPRKSDPTAMLPTLATEDEEESDALAAE
jgi:hypothetical protein